MTVRIHTLNVADPGAIFDDLPVLEISSHDHFYFVADLFSELPDPVNWESSLAYAKDTTRLYFSDGAVWRQIRY